MDKDNPKLTRFKQFKLIKSIILTQNKARFYTADVRVNVLNV